MSLLDSLSEPLKAADNLFTSDKERLEGKSKLEEIQQKPELLLLEIYKQVMADSSKSLFNSAWPHLIGWTAGFLIMLYYTPQLIIMIYVWGHHCIDTNKVTPFPMKSSEILNLVYLLFGMGAYAFLKRK